MSYIKNIEPEVNLKLADQIAVLPGQIVSKRWRRTMPSA